MEIILRHKEGSKKHSAGDSWIPDHFAWAVPKDGCECHQRLKEGQAIQEENGVGHSKLGQSRKDVLNHSEGASMSANVHGPSRHAHGIH